MIKHCLWLSSTVMWTYSTVSLYIPLTSASETIIYVLRCFHHVPYPYVISPLMVISYCTLSLALNNCWLISTFVWKCIICSTFLLCSKCYCSLLFIHHVFENTPSLLCTKNETLCTLNIILCTIIIYFNVFASSFVFSIYSYTLDVSSCCRIFWVCIVVKCSDSCGGCSCTTDVWACATVSTFATLPSTSGPKPFVPVLCILKSCTTSIWGSIHHQCICTVLTLKLKCLYLIPVLPFNRLVSLRKSFHPLVSLFSQLQNNSNNNTYFIELLWGFKALNVKCFD